MSLESEVRNRNEMVPPAPVLGGQFVFTTPRRVSGFGLQISLPARGRGIAVSVEGRNDAEENGHHKR